MSYVPTLLAACAGALLYGVYRRRRVYDGNMLLSSPDGAQVDKRELAEASSHMDRLFALTVTAAMCHLGDALGIYETIYDKGVVTIQELATITGYDERWLKEWLYQQTAAGILKHDSGKFAFKNKAYGLLLISHTHKHGSRSLAGMVRLLRPVYTRITTSLHDCFVTGIGLPYDGPSGKELTECIEIHHANVFRYVLCDKLLTREELLGGALIKKLENGDCKVADVGCGAGGSLVAMGKRFPKSTFVGFELSQDALEASRNAIQYHRLANAKMTDVSQTPLGSTPESSNFDFLLCYDLIHDMADPMSLLRQARKALKPSGCWLIVDIKCSADLDTNLKDPAAEARYGISCGVCLASGLSQKDGMGLGIMGLHADLMKELALQAGFSSCTPFTIPELPSNSCFVLAP